MSSKPPVPILMVDDNASKRLALKSILLPLGYSLVEADCGREALRCVMAQDFAVILMDVVMPDMDGFETAALIRERRQSQMTPIIFITNHGKDEIARPDLYAEGAVDFIFAPVAPNELRAKVSVFANLFVRAEELAARARELKTSADQLRLLTDAAPVGIFQTDAEGHYVYTNPRWSEITGVTSEEAHGKDWATVIGAELPEGSAEGAEPSGRFELGGTGPGAVIVLATSRAIPDSEGGTAGWVGTLADVTTEVRAEKAMAEARDAATEASRLKSDFLANMSHEIRTPMNGVIGMAELLLETDLDATQQDYAQTVHSSGEALLTIIDDILDFSKIEAGRLETEDVEFDLHSTVEGVADLLAGSAHAKGIEMVVAIDSAVPVIAGGDPGRVRQVLINLIGNAIKFTQAGEVIVRVTMGKASGDESIVRFEVSDTGDGMSPEKRDLIFDPFVQADSSTSRKYGGTGLGLAISRQLVELMGGTCGVDSELGKGSDFWFTVAVRADLAQAAASNSSSGTGLAGRSVLLVEENPTWRGVLSEYLSGWGMTVETTGSAEAALAAVRAGEAQGRGFDVALLDGSMPGVGDGDLKDEIGSESGSATKLVLMTRRGQEEAPAPGPEVHAYLSKPVSRRELSARLRLATGLDEEPIAQPPDARASTPPPESAGRILLAEDNLINQKVAVAMLSGAGYRVDTVPNGVEAVEAAGKHGYVAILMDCQMPELDGYEATAAIRARQSGGAQTPIIALTAGGRAEDRERCMAAGMDSYLAKPVSKAALLAMVARFATSAPALTGALNEKVVADLEALEGAVLSDLTSIYFEQAEARIADLDEAISLGEATAVSSMAHELKGSSRTLGATHVSRIASELETTARSGDLTTGGDLLAWTPPTLTPQAA